jgi:hypothetical protein
MDWFLNSIREKNSLVVTGKLEEFDEPHRSEKPFWKWRLNTINEGVIENLDGRKHSCDEITVTTPLNHKAKVRMKNLGDDVWDTTLAYVRQAHRVGKFKGREHAIQAATKKAIEIADAPPSPGRSFACATTPNARATDLRRRSPLHLFQVPSCSSREKLT